MAPPSFRGAFITVCLYLFGLAQVSAVTTKGLGSIYCSDINTSSGSSTSQQFQSHGACTGTCSGYAFAILQDSNCWCSNDAPAGSNSTTGCTKRCPGYGFEFCGDTTGEWFSYVELGATPSGTIGASSAAPSSTSASVSTPSSTSQKQTSTSSSTTTTSPSWTPTPVISIFTTTGQVKTVTFTPTSSPNSQSGLGVSKSSGGGLGTGGAVGLTIGLVALFAIIGAAVWYCLYKKRKKQKESEDFAYGSSRRGSSAGLGGPALEGGKVPQRTMSENSRYALATDGRQVVEAWEAGDAPNRRQSRLMPVDPRLDPFAPVYQRGDLSKSRESVNTIRDDHDYSRRVVHQGPILRATNPDAGNDD